VVESSLACCSFERDGIVATIDSVVYDEYVLACLEHYAVAVLGVPGAVDMNTVNDEVRTVLQFEVELRRVDDGNTADECTFAALEEYNRLAQRLLLCYRLCQVRKILQVVRIPNLVIALVGCSKEIISDEENQLARTSQLSITTRADGDLANIKDGLVFTSEGDAIWQCRNCGHIVVGPKAPEVCPVCDHPQAHFELLAQNY